MPVKRSFIFCTLLNTFSLKTISAYYKNFFLFFNIFPSHFSIVSFVIKLELLVLFQALYIKCFCYCMSMGVFAYTRIFTSIQDFDLIFIQEFSNINLKNASLYSLLYGRIRILCFSLPYCICWLWKMKLYCWLERNREKEVFEYYEGEISNCQFCENSHFLDYTIM